MFSRIVASLAMTFASGLGTAASNVTVFQPVQPKQVTVFVSDQPHYVGRSGSQLILDGKPFRFTGLNIFDAANLDSTACWYPWGQGDALDQALTTIGPGQTVFRVWYFQRMATVNGQRDWSGLDHTLAVARAHHERIMVALGNQWTDCEGDGSFFKTEDWYQHGYRDTPAPGLPETYRDWVTEVVSRYRDEGTILAWQLMNEPSDQVSMGGACSPTAGATMKAFASDMASLIKQIDPAHLVSLGTLGGGECGTTGSDYQAVNSIPQIDLCEFHEYSPASPAFPPQGWNVLQQRLAQCGALNKPLIIAEAGIQVKDAGSVAKRAAIFRQRIPAWFAAGVSGVLIWDLGSPTETPGPGWSVLPGDPVLSLLGGV